MSEYQYFLNGGGKRNSWLGLIGLAFVLVILFFLSTFLFKILYWLSPLLLILTLIFDYKVVIKFGKMLWSLLKRSPILGVLAVVLSVVAFPVVTGGLFVTALMNRKIKKAKKKYTGTSEPEKNNFSEFELLEEEALDLKEMEKRVNE